MCLFDVSMSKCFFVCVKCELLHCEDSGDSESDSSRRCSPVKPEGDPGDDDDEARRDVDLDHVVAHRADELHLASQSRVVA